MYHQECLEKFLKGNKLEKNRKTGFKCPRGCGKGTKFDQPCPGRIDKSHPIHPRNEEAKKKKLQAVVVPEAPAKPPKPGKAEKDKDKGRDKDGDATANVKAAKAAKEDTKKDAARVASGNGASTSAAATKGTAAASPIPVLSLKPAKSSKDSAVLPKAKLDRERETIALMRRDLGLAPAATQGSGLASSGSKGNLAGLAGPSKAAASSPTVVAANAWAKAPAATTAAPPEPPPAPVPTTLNQHPQLMQLFQQASSKKAAAKAPPPAPVASQQPPKPVPAVPQPVLNPPTPSWPALGATQASAATLLASAASAPQPSPAAGSGGSGLTPRDSMANGLQAQPSAPQPSHAHPPPPPQQQQGTAGQADRPRSPDQEPTEEPAAPALDEQPPAADAAPGQAEPGDEGSGGQLAKLTKAQKKNLKRAEKKKGVAASTGSQQGALEGCDATSASSTGDLASAGGRGSSAALALPDDPEEPHLPPPPAAASTAAAGVGSSAAAAAAARPAAAAEPAAGPPSAAALEDQFLVSVVGRKMLGLMGQLQRLGVPEWLAAAAIARHGSDLLAALEWLLTSDVTSPAAVLAEAAAGRQADDGSVGGLGGDGEIDISDELRQLAEVAEMGLATDALQEAVIRCEGDVAAAVAATLQQLQLMQQQQRAQHHHQQQQPASVATSGEGISAHSSMATMPTFYSVSSLDLQPEPEQHQHQHKPHHHHHYNLQQQQQHHHHPQHQPAVQQQQQHHHHHQQLKPATYSGHFGVRLTEPEPSPVPAAVAAAGPDRQGWAGANGVYAAEPAGVPGQRTTSRLTHWLKEDARPAAGHAGAAATAYDDNGIGPCDPPLESPFDGLRSVASGSSSNVPSLQNWLGTNGYHGGPHSGASTSSGAGSQGLSSSGPSRELYNAHSGFSFSSVIGKAASPGLGGGGSGAGGLGAGQAFGAMHWGSSLGPGIPEGDAQAENDDISSIMALINVR